MTEQEDLQMETTTALYGVCVDSGLSPFEQIAALELTKAAILAVLMEPEESTRD